jgi:Domain of unknown function (DUF1905)
VKSQKPKPSGRVKSAAKKTFRAELQKSPSKGGWTYIIWPRSVESFGTRGLVKVRVKIDGHPVAGSLMARGDGTHMLPVKSQIRQVIGKQAGATVKISLLKLLK